FLMPRNFLCSVFEGMFGGPLDGAAPNQHLADAVSAGKDRAGNKRRIRWSPKGFAALSPLARASAIASAHMYKGRFFASLTDQFHVSQKAMGIQLLQLGLVR